VRTAIDWIAGNIVELSAAAVLLYLLLKLLVRAVPRWLHHWRLARERRKASEASQFGRLLSAIGSGDADRTTAAFWQWWQCLQRDGFVARNASTADVPAFREPDAAWLQFTGARYRDQDPELQTRLLRNLRNNVRHGRKQLLRGSLTSQVSVRNDRLNP